MAVVHCIQIAYKRAAIDKLLACKTLRMFRLQCSALFLFLSIKLDSYASITTPLFSEFFIPIIVFKYHLANGDLNIYRLSKRIEII